MLKKPQAQSYNVAKAKSSTDTSVKSQKLIARLGLLHVFHFDVLRHQLSFIIAVETKCLLKTQVTENRKQSLDSERF